MKNYKVSFAVICAVSIGALSGCDWGQPFTGVVHEIVDKPSITYNGKTYQRREIETVDSSGDVIGGQMEVNVGGWIPCTPNCPDAIEEELQNIARESQRDDDGSDSGHSD